MGHALRKYDLHPDRQVRAIFEVSNVDAITPLMWRKLLRSYEAILHFNLHEFYEMNIVRIIFVEHGGYELRSIGNTPFRILVLPHEPQVENILKETLNRI